MLKIYARANRNYEFSTPAFYPLIIVKGEITFIELPFGKNSCCVNKQDALNQAIRHAKDIAFIHADLNPKIIVNGQIYNNE